MRTFTTSSPASATRGVTPEAAATPSQRRKFRRSKRVLSSSANNARLPGGLLFLGLGDRRLGQGFGLFGVGDGGIEVAGRGRLLGRGQGLLGGNPLVLQRAGVLLGGFGGGERGFEIGLAARRLRRTGANQPTRHCKIYPHAHVASSAVTAACPARRSAGRCSCRTDNIRRRDKARPAA